MLVTGTFQAQERSAPEIPIFRTRVYKPLVKKHATVKIKISQSKQPYPLRYEKE